MFLHFGHSMGLNRLMTMVDFLKKKKKIHSHHILSFMICVLSPSKNDLR